MSPHTSLLYFNRLLFGIWW